ncbi:MAG TPA: alpha/beta fold hydrolase [Conexibacter sp.]|nr:alpha/beta fold hydrolase [Conexibacter sp.]
MANANADWRSTDLGPARTLELDGARVRAHVTGEGPAIVFVHGALVNANLWRKVVPRLDGFTRVTLDLPLGSHLIPVPARPNTPPDIAKLIGEAVTALDLHDVTLVGNDTGGAICQLAAAERPDWLGRLVLTSCDAFEHFPPPRLKPLFALLRLPGGLRAGYALMRFRAPRHLPIAFGWLVHERIPDDATDSYVLPVIQNAGVRDDATRLARGVDPADTLAAAEKLRSFDRPALIAWSADDRFFPPSDGERLAATIPGARLEWIAGARTFSAEDRPERLAELIASFAREPVGGAA